MERRRISSGSPYEPAAGFEHVVGTRIWVTSRDHWDEVARAHAEVFGGTRPAATALAGSLLDPRWLVEIEADALLE